MSNTKQLLREARALKAKANKAQGDTYYELEELLRAKLLDVLDADLNELSKRQLFELLAYCSSHRPKALHVILMDFAEVFKRETEDKPESFEPEDIGRNGWKIDGGGY